MAFGIEKNNQTFSIIFQSGAFHNDTSNINAQDDERGRAAK